MKESNSAAKVPKTALDTFLKHFSDLFECRDDALFALISMVKNSFWTAKCLSMSDRKYVSNHSNLLERANFLDFASEFI